MVSRLQKKSSVIWVMMCQSYWFPPTDQVVKAEAREAGIGGLSPSLLIHAVSYALRVNSWILKQNINTRHRTRISACPDARILLAGCDLTGRWQGNCTLVWALEAGLGWRQPDMCGQVPNLTTGAITKYHPLWTYGCPRLACDRVSTRLSNPGWIACADALSVSINSHERGCFSLTTALPGFAVWMPICKASDIVIDPPVKTVVFRVIMPLSDALWTHAWRASAV